MGAFAREIFMSPLYNHTEARTKKNQLVLHTDIRLLTHEAYHILFTQQQQSLFLISQILNHTSAIYNSFIHANSLFPQ